MWELSIKFNPFTRHLNVTSRSSNECDKCVSIDCADGLNITHKNEPQPKKNVVSTSQVLYSFGIT
jgi:hypothetical protein